MNNYLVGENELLFPKVDFLFAQIFGSEESADLLCSLISSVLKVPEESLKDIKVLNPKLSKDITDDRTGILDIKAEVNGEQINIEMQVTPHRAMAERVIFYWAKVFTAPFESSMKFHELKRTVSIIICDEDFLPIEKYHSKFHLWEDDERYKFSDALEIHVLEIQKALNSVDNEKNRIADPLLRWLWFLANNDEEVCEMLSQQSVAMHKAVDLQERYSKTREMRDAYMRRMVAMGDENTRIHFAREDGMTTILRYMAQTGNTPVQISSSTGLPIDDVLRMLK